MEDPIVLDVEGGTGPVSNNPVAAGCDAIAALYLYTMGHFE